MAKGKHAAALFEVIHSGKDRQEDKSGILRTPKWWFKNRPKPQSPPGVIPTPRRVEAEDEPSSPPAFARPEEFTRNRPSRRITLRVTYRSAALWGTCAAAIIAIGFIIGHKMRGGPAPAVAGSIEQLREGRANGEALRVGAGSATNNGTTGVASAPPTTSAPLSQQITSGDAGSKAPAPVFSGKRVVGLQYVVVQSYPKEADAKAAADLLGKNGIPCTIQAGFWPGRSDWFTVIGTTGFERTKNNPDYTKYLQTIARVSSDFAGKTRFRQFDPVLYTWKDPNH